MSSNKNIDTYFKKKTKSDESGTSVTKKDNDDEDEIVFLAEYMGLHKLETKKKDSEEPAYTLDADSTLDFSTDEEEDFWKKIDSAECCFNSTTKVASIDVDDDDNDDDDEEDEDIKLIFDSTVRILNFIINLLLVISLLVLNRAIFQYFFVKNR